MLQFSCNNFCSGYFWHYLAFAIIIDTVNTVAFPLPVLQFCMCCHLPFIFNDPKSIITVQSF